VKHYEYEYVVVGLGGLGSAAAYWLARNGADVAGVEQFVLDHDRGASRDHSRIIRLSYHAPMYVELAARAFEVWAEVEDELGESLIVRTGGLDLWPAHAAIPMSDYTGSLNRLGVPFDLLDAAEVMREWPQFTLSDDVVGLWQQSGGIVGAARCNDAHLRLARAHGATVLEQHKVASLARRGDHIEVAGDDFSVSCRKVIVAADAWTNDVLRHVGWDLPLTITQEQVTYFAPTRLEDFAPGRFPVWIWMDDPSFYGVPVYGERGVKVGQDVGGARVTADERTFDVDEAALERVTSFLERCIPSARGSILYTKPCLYTMPPDRDLIVGRLPDYPGVIVLQGAAHGFKFASLLGKIASELAIDGRTAHDIGPFAMDRPALGARREAGSFLI
jgi:sarcosine oxidase